MAEGRPELGDIKTKLSERERAYSELRGQQEIDAGFYEGTNDLGIQRPYHVVRTGIGAELIEVPVQRLLGVAVDKSEPRDTTVKAEAELVKRSQFTDAFVDLYRAEIHYAFKLQQLRGVCYLQVLLDEGRLEPKKKVGESEGEYRERYKRWSFMNMRRFPIVLRSPDAMLVYPSAMVFENGMPKDVVVKYGRTVGDILSMYPNWRNPNNKKMDASVDWVEYWGEEWRGYWADWEPILGGGVIAGGVIPNEWGFVPFVRVLSGHGVRDPEGKPEVEARGLLYNYRGRVEAFERGISFADSMAALYSHPTGEIIAETEEEYQKMAKDLIMAPGYMSWRKPDGTLGVDIRVPPPASEAMMVHSSFLNGLIEQSAHIGLLGGYSSARSGVQQGMSVSWARVAFEPSIRRIEDGLSTAIAMVLRLVETQMEAGVTIRATVVENEKASRKDIVLKPEDIDGNYLVEMRFEQEDAQANDVRQMAGLNLYKAGAISWTTFLKEYCGVKDPDAEINRAMAERWVQSSPVIREMVEQDAARRRGVELGEVLAAEDTEMRRRTPQMPQGTIYGAQGEELVSPEQAAQQLAVRQYRRGAEAASLTGGTAGYPMAAPAPGIGGV